MANKIINKLPAVFRTPTQQGFFDATFEQVFSKKDSSLLSGFIGRRVPGQFSPITDYYIPEPTRGRTWWQLEATAYARDTSTNKTNVMFYDDMLNYLSSKGANVTNDDRLFSSDYYCWAPPIDYDMFINYQNYYWVDQGLPIIPISGVAGADIVGQLTFTTPSTASPANLKLTTGMRILLKDDEINYPSVVTIQNIGGSVGIRLVKDYGNVGISTVYEALPWDGILQLQDGRYIVNNLWDEGTWSATSYLSNSEYITMERGCIDNNAWSRANQWVHIDAINATVAALGIAFPVNARRALRPIIQFDADLELYKSGIQFKSLISYALLNDMFGNPLKLSDYNNKPISFIQQSLNFYPKAGDTVMFLGDTGVQGSSIINKTIYTVSITSGIVSFVVSGQSPIVNGDIIINLNSSNTNSPTAGQTWYYTSATGSWAESHNDKIDSNQYPLFQLYDHNGVRLDDSSVYPSSTFVGNEIFSYKPNLVPNASIDPVLGFAIVYSSLGQAGDIVFENTLNIDRYTYTDQEIPIEGYYYYKKNTSSKIHNGWEKFNPADSGHVSGANTISVSKQRVIDMVVYGYGATNQVQLSVTPYGYPSSPDIIVSVNGVEVKNITSQINGYTISTINGTVVVDLTDYMNALIATSPTQPPVIEVQTYTYDALPPDATGYFSIPQQLEANPTQMEVTYITASELTPHLTSVIAAQNGLVGDANSNNNYRDTAKNEALGQYIIQNTTPLLKSMLVSSDDDLDFVSALEFSQDEYTKFKNRYLSTAKRLIDQGFDPLQLQRNTIVVSQWVDEILKVMNVSREFSNAFAYSNMIASGTPLTIENANTDNTGEIVFTNYVDLSSPTNMVYFYVNQQLLVRGVDYNFISTDGVIDVKFNNLSTGTQVTAVFYTLTIPAYIPSTPTRLGLAISYIPELVLDSSYVVPTNVILGHDGSKTVAYGDYRDQLLLELERRIYNSLPSEFANEYEPQFRVDNILPSQSRISRYSRAEFLEISKPAFNRWTAKNRANATTNDWSSLAGSTPVNMLWKLYNYTTAITNDGRHLGLPGNWRGIFMQYYGTLTPATTPWQMLGFSNKPDWWVQQYGTDYSSNNVSMWNDLANGIIRQGPRAIYDQETNSAVSNPLWVRTTLPTFLPVDTHGTQRTVPDIFNILVVDPYEPFDGFDNPWVYGDLSPVEYAWTISSGYQYTLQELLFLMYPSQYGEYNWDSIGTTLSPGYISVSTSQTPVKSLYGQQYVQNTAYSSGIADMAWMRPRNTTQVVHAETTNGVTQYRFGYQTWISDRILFLGKDVTTTFGQKIRTLDVNLGNKVSGFVNKDTLMTYIESVTPGVTNTNLAIPPTNMEVMLHTSPSLGRYAYSGVIVRINDTGTFTVYGYDLLTSQFNVYERSDATQYDITVGGEPAPYVYYSANASYMAGDIVRYNGSYYSAKVSFTSGNSFDSSEWTRLPSLPISGGISVSYKPQTSGVVKSIPYGTELNSVQEVFDMLIGWGDFLKETGWDFSTVNSDTNELNDWLGSGKQFLFWLNSNWTASSAIELSPLAMGASVTVFRGYPSNVERITNGVYNILDRFGVAISPANTNVTRDGQSITVAPYDNTTGIFFLAITATETEHIILFDNVTNFNDVVYSPLLRVRQNRLRFYGFRSNGWFGKMEAPGYLIVNDQLVPNFDNIVESMRYYYDPDTIIDNQSFEDLGRHLIGYESKQYLDDMQLTSDTQYLFYQGVIRQKGTAQAFSKLFRSNKVQNNDQITIYEEWALKVGNFGNTVETVSTEIVVTPEKNSGEVVVARLNYIPSKIGYVEQILIVNAQTKYSSVPTLIIDAPDASPNDPAVDQPLRTAQAYVVLDSNGRILRVDITDGGYGYITQPHVRISAANQTSGYDQLAAIVRGEIIKDTTLDNIIEIDVDDQPKWPVRPTDPAYALEMPTITNDKFYIPNAGYVHKNDVDLMSFDQNSTALNWGTSTFNPVDDTTIWIAKTFTEDWSVYKMIEFADQTKWTIQVDDSNNLMLLTQYDSMTNPYALYDQFGDPASYHTDFGNMVSIQINSNGVVNGDTNYAVCFQPNGTYTDPATLVTYNRYDLVTLSGDYITGTQIPQYDSMTDVLLFKSMRFETAQLSYPSYVSTGDLIWIDNIPSNEWQVLSIGQASNTVHRTQSPLIDTSLFENAQLFETSTGNQLVNLPVFDPFKGILPGPAMQNIQYITYNDPARYNVTGDPRLLTNNVIFGESQVGMLWWDLTNTRYMYYEQPRSLNNDEGATANLEYRRDNWGMLFDGSTVEIYEWVSSPVPPASYAGSGTPRDVTTYIQSNIVDRFTGLVTTNYYFWVSGNTNKPNKVNRTLTSVDVQNMLQNPKGQGYAYFAPIQQTDVNNSYMFVNVQEILSYKGDHIQLNYRRSTRDDQPHKQWALYREGDASSLIPDQFWNKLTDSICGYTEELPSSVDYPNAITIARNLKWSQYGWDAAPWDSYVSGMTPVYAKVLAVPDPVLGPQEAYGINYRPRQSMFSDIYSARKVFAQAVNQLLSQIPIRDNDPNWNTMVSTSVFWDYVTWYASGFDNVSPDVVYMTLADAISDLSAGKLTNGTIVQVTNGTADGRFIYYQVVQPTADSAQSFNKIAIEASAINLLASVATTTNLYSLSVELRELMQAFRSTVMVNDNIVDQNLLFFAMVNYVLSEQRNPDWVMKTSYVYIKESQIELKQDPIYIPDQIQNIVDYIADVKPYHTQVRDYVASYNTTDSVSGTAFDNHIINAILTFGPRGIGSWDNSPWDSIPWDAMVSSTTTVYVDASNFSSPQIAQFLSHEDVYELNIINNVDPSKAGLSKLFPYTVNFNQLNINNPQSIIAPQQLVMVKLNNSLLFNGKDYYANINSDGTYTIYFFADPSSATQLISYILFDGGHLQNVNFDSDRNELAIGFPSGSLSIVVTTKLPVDVSTGTMRPYVGGWGQVWDQYNDPLVSSIIASHGGTSSLLWDSSTSKPTILDNTIAYREFTSNGTTSNIRMRPADSVTLVGSYLVGQPTIIPNIPAHDATQDGLITIRISVDMSVHTDKVDILPDPDAGSPCIIWMDGERMAYNKKVQVNINTWDVSQVERGTMKTSTPVHTPTIVDPNTGLPVANLIYIERNNVMPATYQGTIWNAISNDSFAPSAQGGVWYSSTDAAEFIKGNI